MWSFIFFISYPTPTVPTHCGNRFWNVFKIHCFPCATFLYLLFLSAIPRFLNYLFAGIPKVEFFLILRKLIGKFHINIYRVLLMNT